jgi:hypothetical protein
MTHVSDTEKEIKISTIANSPPFDTTPISVKNPARWLAGHYKNPQKSGSSVFPSYYVLVREM